MMSEGGKIPTNTEGFDRRIREATQDLRRAISEKKRVELELIDARARVAGRLGDLKLLEDRKAELMAEISKV